MMKTHLRLLPPIFFALMIYSVASFAQLNGTLLRPGNIEFGYSYKYFNRQFDGIFDTGADNAKWGYFSLYSKYGFFDWLSASIEGSIYKYPSDLYPERDYMSYQFGVGIQTHLFSIQGFQVIPTVYYSNFYNHDRSSYRHEKQETSVFAGISFQKMIQASSIRTVLFITPALILDQTKDDSPQCVAISNSINNFGAAVGCDVLISERFHFVGEIVYASFFQPRVQVGYQLR